MADTNQNTNGGEQEQKTAVTFDEAQQTRINELIEQRLNRQKSSIERTAQEAADAKAADKLTTLEAELAALKGSKKIDDTDKDKDAEKLQFKGLLDAEKANTAAVKKQLETAESERKTVLEKNKEILKNVAIREAVSGQETFQFHNFDTVRRLTEHLVSWDEEAGAFVVKDERGIIQQNSSMQPQTLAEFYTTFAAQHPYLVSSATKGGTGAGESNRTFAGGLAKVTSKADLKTVKDKVGFINKFGQEAFEQLPLK